MIPIWQAFAYAFLAGGFGTMVGIVIMAALAMAHDSDERMEGRR